MIDEKPKKNLAESINTFIRSKGLYPKLTRREMVVLNTLILQSRYNFNNKTIAEELGLHEGTVKCHLGSIFKKMKVKNKICLMFRIFFDFYHKSSVILPEGEETWKKN